MREGEWYLIGNHSIVYIDNFLAKGEIVNAKIFNKNGIKVMQPYSEHLLGIIKKACHYTNIQPLKAILNLRKNRY